MKRKYHTKVIDGEKVWIKFCDCGNEQQYSSIRSAWNAFRLKSKCQSCSNSGKNNPFYGKTHTTNHRKKLVKSQKICSNRYKSIGKNPDKIEKVCRFCKITFMVTLCRSNASYCSFKCASKDCFGLGENRKTKPEQIVEQYLIDNKIGYEYQYYLVDRCFDFYIPSKHLLIEVDGVYWHGKGLKFKQCNKFQKRARINDKYKNGLSKKHGYNLLRIWEDEIDNVSKYLR